MYPVRRNLNLPELSSRKRRHDIRLLFIIPRPVCLAGDLEAKGARILRRDPQGFGVEVAVAGGGVGGADGARETIGAGHEGVGAGVRGDICRLSDHGRIEELVRWRRVRDRRHAL